MEEDSHPRTSNAGSISTMGRTRKLKDTCDMCSASKVRCDKTKPVCSRCERLEYPCFYSPAQRVRKRPCIQRVSSVAELESNNSSDSPESQGEGKGRERSVAAKSTSSNNSNNHDGLDSRGINNQGSEHHFDADSFANLSGNVTPIHEQVNELKLHLYNFTRPSYAPDESGNIQRNGSFSSNHRIDAFKPYTVPSFANTCNGSNNSNTLFFQPPAKGTKSTANTLEAMCMDLDVEETKNANPPELDCAMVAMDILQQLTVINKARHPPTPGPSTKPSSLEFQFHTATMAIKRVSSILICPCSKKPDIGLLAAAVCASLLDTYEVILRRSIKGTVKPHRRGTSSDAANMYNTPSSTPKSTNSDSTDEQAVVMRILEELPKIANLVTQFGKRYNQDAEKMLQELLQSVAATIRLRLKAMINEITNWVAQI